MSNINEAQLLKDNRDALVSQLKSLGVAVTDETPMSEIAEMMKWAGGLRDLRLATLNKSTGAYADYSLDEWESLSASAKAGVVKLGIRIRAELQDFIISKDNIKSPTSTTTMMWCSNNSTDVTGLTNFGSGSTGAFLDFDGEANTDKILAMAETVTATFPAATQARAYKASTLADDNYADPTKWSLPALGQLLLFYKYKTKINEAFTEFFGSSQLITDDYYWSSTEYSSSYAWIVHLNYGYMSGNGKTNTYRVRAVAPVPVSASAAI